MAKGLDEITEKVVNYVNQGVAHIQLERSNDVVTYAEFDSAIIYLGDLLSEIYLLLKQDSLITPTPVIQGDWKGPFRRPLAELFSGRDE